MLNQVVLVGRLVAKPTLEREETKKTSVITLAVPRGFKNEEGVYETDFIKCILWGNVATNTVEYCFKGDLIGIRGRLQSRDGQLEIVADKVTFLSSNKRED